MVLREAAPLLRQEAKQKHIWSIPWHEATGKAGFWVPAHFWPSVGIQQICVCCLLFMLEGGHFLQSTSSKQA